MAWRWFCAVQDVLLHTAGTLKWNFQCPFVRELMLALGLVDVSPTTLLKVSARPTEFRKLATFSAAFHLAMLFHLRTMQGLRAYVHKQLSLYTAVCCLSVVLQAGWHKPGRSAENSCRSWGSPAGLWPWLWEVQKSPCCLALALLTLYWKRGKALSG